MYDRISETLVNVFLIPNYYLSKGKTLGNTRLFMLRWCIYFVVDVVLPGVVEITVQVVTPAHFHLQIGAEPRWIPINSQNSLRFLKPIESINCKGEVQIR